MAIQVPTYDFNGAQVKVNLRTVAGVRQLFRFQFVRSGSVVSMEGQKFTGRVNTSPVTEFECVGNEEGVDIVWGKLPAGRFSYEVCCGSQVVFYGDMIVQGRMLPPLAGEGDVSVNDSLVMSVEEESIAFECSEVGLMTLLERQAMVYMGESKELRDEVAELHQAVENKVAEAGSDLSQMLEQAEAAKTKAEESATLASEFAEYVENKHGLVDELAQQVTSDAEVASRAKSSGEQTLASVMVYAQSAEQAKVEAEQAKASAEQEAYNAYSHGSAAKASADVAVSKAEEAKESATNALESETKAKEAQTATETLANELNEQYERAVFTDNSGNVDIEGGLTVDGTANLNGGAIVPEPTTNENPQTYGLARSHEAVVRPVIQAWFNEQTRLDGLYKENSDIRIFDYDLPKLTHGYQMFHKSSLEVFSGTIPELLHGNSFFSSSKVKSVLPIWPKLVNGRSFYTNCFSISGEVVVDAPYVIDMDSCFYGTNIESFEGNLPSVVKLSSCFRFRTTITSLKLTGTSKLTHIGVMCEGCTNLEVFEGDLSAVIYALNAFSNTKLNKSSALCVLNGLREKVDGLATEPNPWTISIGVHIDLQNDEEILIAADNARARGWSVTLQWKGTPSA